MTLIEKLLDERDAAQAAMLNRARERDVPGIAKHSAMIMALNWRLITAVRMQFRFGIG